MKIGIIRCQQIEEICCGVRCFQSIRDKSNSFSAIQEDIEIVGFSTCGGCPGKRIISKAKVLVDFGTEAIFLSSCISKGDPIDFKCPYFSEINLKLLKAYPNIKFYISTH